MTSVINHAHAGIYAGYGLLGAVVGTVEAFMVLAAQMVVDNLPKHTKVTLRRIMVVCIVYKGRVGVGWKLVWDG